MTIGQIALFGMLGALTFAAKVAMSFLPNIEPVSLFVMLFAVVFGRKIKDDALHKAFVIISLGLCWVIFASFLLTVLEPELSLSAVLFEIVSATATVGLSMDVTPTLGTAAKLVIILTMYIGRLGPLTIATMWVNPQKGISRPEEDIPIG